MTEPEIEQKPTLKLRPEPDTNPWLEIAVGVKWFLALLGAALVVASALIPWNHIL